jgi:hypothetical protein
MDLAVRAGATSVGELNFFRSDARAVYRRALVAALADARLKASELARASGLTLGRVRSIRESGFEDSVTGQGDAQARAPRAEAPPVAPGTSTVEGRCSWSSRRHRSEAQSDEPSPDLHIVHDPSRGAEATASHNLTQGAVVSVVVAAGPCCRPGANERWRA